MNLGRYLLIQDAACLLFELQDMNAWSVQVCDTINIDDARRSYFGSLFPLNAGGIIPTGPTLADLKLSLDPQRGSSKHENIFHTTAPAALPAPVS